jgi:hypothetical protein
LVGSEEKGGRAPPFIGKTLIFLPPHGRADAWPRARADALPRPRGPVAARRVSTCYRTDERSRARADPRLRGRDFYRADAVFTTSVGKCGFGRTFGRKGRPDGHFHPKTSVMTSLTSTDMNLCCTAVREPDQMRKLLRLSLSNRRGVR